MAEPSRAKRPPQRKAAAKAETRIAGNAVSAARGDDNNSGDDLGYDDAFFPYASVATAPSSPAKRSPTLGAIAPAAPPSVAAAASAALAAAAEEEREKRIADAVLASLMRSLS